MDRLVTIHFRVIANYYHKQYSLKEQLIDYVRKDNIAGCCVSVQ